MIIFVLIQFAVCLLVMFWVLKKKPGEKYSKKAVFRFLLLGVLSTFLAMMIGSALSLERDTFFGMNPILSGFVTALLTAAILEETAKYICFRLAIWKNREVICWLDVIIAAVLIGVGFTLLEDFEFALGGAANILRALLPGHLLYQGIMGYYYGKARVTKQFKYHVLSLAVPILWHTAFDMFLIGMMSIVNGQNLSEISEEALMSLPYAEYLKPMIAGAGVTAVITFIGLVWMLRKIAVWSKNGEKQERLAGEPE